jgi:hypothetical protein
MIFEGYTLKQKEKRQALISLAWYIEAFARQKRLPRLEKLLKDTDKKQQTRQEMTKSDMIEIARNKGLWGPWNRRC